MNHPIQRALLSVSDKTGIVSLARCLSEFGCELISTGNTAKLLRESGLVVTDITRVTEDPEAFGGRMKTISFEVESALLFDRERDREEAQKLGIEPIDMVVCNFYPFERARDAEADLERLIEEIDIGGPTMVRAAAKNFRWVAVVTDPAQYDRVERELKAGNGGLSFETRFEFMRAAFNRTADYDAAIAVTLDDRADDPSLRLAFSGGMTLRYGENSHQSARFFREHGATDSLYDLELLSGKALSYNNMVDIEAALSTVCDLKPTACAIIKHTNPCGLSQSADPRTAFEAAWAGDPMSAFGSVIAFNRPLTRNTADFLQLDREEKFKRKFVEVVVAPDFDEGTQDYLRLHKNLRVVRFDPARCVRDRSMHFSTGSLLVQDTDGELMSEKTWVTEQQVELDDELLSFGLVAARQLKSNAIAIVRRTAGDTLQLLGMGAGQPNRVTSTRLAVERAIENLATEYRTQIESKEGAQIDRAQVQARQDEVAQIDAMNREAWISEQMSRAVLVSDAFFPFPDNIEVLAQGGVRTVVQPGGSIRDRLVVRRCDELGVAMMMTGTRHFKH